MFQEMEIVVSRKYHIYIFNINSFEIINNYFNTYIFCTMFIVFFYVFSAIRGALFPSTQLNIKYDVNANSDAIKLHSISQLPHLGNGSCLFTIENQGWKDM